MQVCPRSRRIPSTLVSDRPNSAWSHSRFCFGNVWLHSRTSTLRSSNTQSYEEERHCFTKCLQACSVTLMSTMLSIVANPIMGGLRSVRMASFVNGFPPWPLFEYRALASISSSGCFIVWKNICQIRQYSILSIKEPTVFVKPSQYVCEYARVSPRNN